MVSYWLALPGFILWVVILLLPWRPWSTRQSLDSGPGHDSNRLARITVVIPARDEQEYIGKTLRSVSQQGPTHKIILVDDDSADNTLIEAQGTGIENLEIIRGELLQPGWTGKLWALEQGRKRVTTEYILLLDADIELKPGILASLLCKADNDDLSLVSLMAFLRMYSPWEKLLVPAFIFFFKLLYPFQLSNSGSKRVSAAAGGCILIRTKVLEDLGGFAALKDALIDDCTLAALVKNNGGKTWTGLTHSAVSHRQYNDLKSIWHMVSRTAFTQLGYSVLLLLLCTALMVAGFILPMVLLPYADFRHNFIPLLTLFTMYWVYFPTLKYYDLNPLWGLCLPFTGTLFLLMTWESAIRHWKGKSAEWKNRIYTR